MEIGTLESDELVQAIYTRLIETTAAGGALTDDERVIHNVEHLSQECNSGASFEQYLTWASVDEISAIAAILSRLGLSNVANLAENAIKTAFGEVLPASDEAKSERMDALEEQQRSTLEELFEDFEGYNGVITNRLAQFARERGIEG